MKRSKKHQTSKQMFCHYFSAVSAFSFLVRIYCNSDNKKLKCAIKKFFSIYEKCYRFIFLWKRRYCLWKFVSSAKIFVSRKYQGITSSLGANSRKQELCRMINLVSITKGEYQMSTTCGICNYQMEGQTPAIDGVPVCDECFVKANDYYVVKCSHCHCFSFLKRNEANTKRFAAIIGERIFQQDQPFVFVFDRCPNCVNWG